MNSADMIKCKNYITSSLTCFWCKGQISIDLTYYYDELLDKSFCQKCFNAFD